MYQQEEQGANYATERSIILIYYQTVCHKNILVFMMLQIFLLFFLQ